MVSVKNKLLFNIFICKETFPPKNHLILAIEVRG